MPKIVEKLFSLFHRKNNKMKIHKSVKRDHKNLLGYIGLSGLILLNLGVFFCLFGGIIDFLSWATLLIASVALIWQIAAMLSTQRISPKLNLTLHIDDDIIILSCFLKNEGTLSIYPYIVNLYIDEGIFNGDICEFDPCTNHKIDDKTGENFDCTLVAHLKDEAKKEEMSEHFTFPPCLLEKFNDKIHYCINLRQLSHYSIKHIMPGEEFREDVVLRLESNKIYRATLVYTGIEYKDCLCRAIKFKYKPPIFNT